MNRLVAAALAAFFFVPPVLAAAPGAITPAPTGNGLPLKLPSGISTTLDASLLGLAPVTGRAPSLNDDATAGFAVGDLWLAPGGVVYQAKQATAGHGVWLQVPAARTRPLDLVPATVAYGNRALKASWLNGNWIDVATTAGGTATTIKFVNGEPDLASLDALLAGGVGYVSKWYDQSGNANDAAQATAANQPVISANNLVAGLRSIVFNSVQSGPAGGQTSKFLTIPTTASFNPITASAAFVAQQRSTVQTGVFAIAGPSNNISWLASFFSTSSSGINSNGNTGSNPVLSPSSPAVTIFAQTNGTMSFWSGNQSQTGVTVGHANTTVTGGNLGGVAIGSSPGQAEMDSLASIIFPSSLSQTQIDNLRASLASLFGIAPQGGRDTILVHDGDSITDGFGATYMQGFPRQALALLGLPVRQYNTGVSGIPLLGSNGLAARFNFVFSKIYSPTARNFVVEEEIGTNDIGTNGTDGATLYAAYVTYCQQIKALGPNVRLIVHTLTPRTDANATQNAAIATFNSLERAGLASGQLPADALIDMAAEPTIGVSMANTTYSPDGLHFTDLGYSYFAPLSASTVLSVLR